MTALILFDGYFHHNTFHIDMTPFFVCLFLGCIVLFDAFVIAACWFFADHPFPTLPAAVRYPIGYLAGLGILSAVLLMMNLFHLFDTQSDLHLPLVGYVSFLIVVYPICGYILGQKLRGRLADLLWGILFAAILWGICYALFHEDGILFGQSWRTEIHSAHDYSSNVRYRMRGNLYAVFSRINLPACVLMDNYADDCYNELYHHFPIDPNMLFYLCSISPPILFSFGWGTAVIREKLSKKSEKGEEGI